MQQTIQNYWDIILLYSPLGAIGLWRWSVWFIKKILSLHYRPILISDKFNPTLSIVTPVYNENPKIFTSALKSWVQNKVNEIIAVIDHSDKKNINEFLKFSKKNKNARLIVIHEPGKRPALAFGVKAARSEFVALVDSDTIWDKNIKKGLLAPFVDPLCGGVCPRQNILKPDSLTRKLFDINLDSRYVDEFPFLSAWGNALTCLSGRTAIYRRRAIINLVDEMVNERFLGKKCISGDDKCLTNLVQSRGWKVRYQGNIKVFTPGVTDFVTYFKQQIRWTRNSWRADLKAIFSKWVWREKILALHLLDKIIQPFTLILGLIYLLLSIALGHWLIVLIILFWLLISRAIKIYPHLKRRPQDVIILPIYIATTYIRGLIKIYTLFSMNEQGWITRWDKQRIPKISLLKATPAYLATILVLFLLSTGSVNYSNYIFNNSKKNIKKPQIVGVKTDYNEYITSNDINSEIDKQNILSLIQEPQFGYYKIQKGDSLLAISRRFNVDFAVILKNNNLSHPNLLNIDQQIKIPVFDLRKTRDISNLVSLQKPNIVFNRINNTIHVQGEASVVTLSGIKNVLKNNNIIEQIGEKTWVLKANLLIEKDVSLIIDSNEVSWLKLKSNEEGFVSLSTYNGSILINNTKITSWDEERQAPDLNYQDGRSFILAKYSSRMDVVNSEIAYLGYQGKPKQGQPVGGLYGISWRIPTDSFKKHLIIGNVINSKFHDNYFGLYTFGATGMIIKQNEFYNNIQYGLDPHDDSNNLQIEGNISHNNGNHGIIISKRVINCIIRGNKSYKNKLHGIMLDRQSNNNLVEKNIVEKNSDGIAIYESNNNLIINNDIKGNKNGIRVNEKSSDNFFEQNKILNNINGFYIYNNANNNHIIKNDIKGNEIGIYIRGAVGNLINNPVVNGLNERDYKINVNAKNIP